MGAAPKKKSKSKAPVAKQQWPADKVERRPISGLIPYARNSRTHSEAQVQKIVASMKEWGWTNPILVDEQGGIIAGHGRILAAQALGWAEVPVMVASGWTEAQKRAYLIADNQLALNAAWDAEILSVELDELRDLGVDLALIGFAPDELNDLIGTPNTGVDADEIPPVPEVATSWPGDLWVMGDHRLLCGDSTSAGDVARLMGDATPHLMVTDPPYGVDYDPTWRDGHGGKFGDGLAKSRGKVTNDDRESWAEAWQLFKGNIAYVWHGERQCVGMALELRAAGFDQRNLIAWAKPSLTFGRGHYHSQHETCWYSVRKGSTAEFIGDHSQTTLWQISGMNPAGRGKIDEENISTGHGTQKPVECMARAIRNHDADVYDPFVGSGTTIIAAEMLARACYACEISPNYVDVAVQRWKKFTGRDSTLESTGQTFEEVKYAREKANAGSTPTRQGKSGEARAT